MSQVWVPASQLTRGSLAQFEAGTIILRAGEYRSEPTSMGVLCRHMTDDGDELTLIYTLSSWYDGRIPPGDIVRIDSNQRFLGFIVAGDQRLEIEVDLSAPTAEEHEGKPQVGCSDQGLRLLGFYGRHEQRMYPHEAAINPETWRLEYPKGGDRGVHTRFDEWRLRLHLSERQAVTLLEAAAPVAGQ